MKKSIRYAGIASATLLTLTPIISTMANPVTTVQAEDASTSVDMNRINEIVDGIKDSLKDQTFVYVTGDDMSTTEYATLLYNAFSSGFNLGGQITADGESSFFPDSMMAFLPDELTDTTTFQNVKFISDDDLAYLINGYNVVFGLKFIDPVTTEENLHDILYPGENVEKPFRVSMELIIIDMNQEDEHIYFQKEIKMIPKINVLPDMSGITSATIDYPNAISVVDGTSVSDIQDMSKVYTKLMDSSPSSFTSGDALGKSIDYAADNILYDNLSSAENALNTGSTDGQVDIGNIFSRSDGDTYYRVVKLGMSPLANHYLMSNRDVTTNGAIVDKSDGTIKYIQKITVNPKPTNNNANNTSGIVTTHSDAEYYNLSNDNNVKIDNRALIKNSSWKVDGVRSVNGIKQYRVSTHEWVNASDVDFVEDGKVTEGMTVTKLDKPKEILLATTHNIYNLQNSKNEVSTTRALAGGTSWLVDKIGTDMHGGIYYGVSTDEFVKAGDGVDASL